MFKSYVVKTGYFVSTVLKNVTSYFIFIDESSSIKLVSSSPPFFTIT
jgi:hypothetical protein